MYALTRTTRRDSLGEKGVYTGDINSDLNSYYLHVHYAQEDYRFFRSIQKLLI